MGRQKSSSLKKVDLPDDNLDEFFGLSQDKNSQETPDVTPTDLPKKSEGRVERGAQKFEPWKHPQVTSRFRG